MGILGRSFSLSARILTVAFLVLWGETCKAKDDNSLSKCTPSSCGNIHNISYPFRLTNDPKHCGESVCTLSCENNIAVLDLPSRKYHVQAINYHNSTIRVVDPGLGNNSCFSIPRHSSPPIFGYPYSPTSIDMCFFKCPNPLNSSRYVDTVPCINTTQLETYSYVTVWEIDARELGEGCSVEWIAPLPLLLVGQNFRPYNNASYKYIDIHNAMMYGFQLHYSPYLTCTRSRWSMNYKCFRDNIVGLFQLIWEAICSFFEPGHYVYLGDNKTHPLINIDQRWLPLIVIGLLYPVKFIFGTPFVMAFLISKWRRRHLSMYSTIEDFLRMDNNFMPIRYNYSQIKTMSNRFKDKLGEGGYGSVFKGKLRSGHFGAIKMLSKPKANGQDFMSEVATIGRINHVNVVQLVGYCVEGPKRALVYDFMPNGSLDKYIYTKEGSTPLSCKQMYEISIGVARGIEYLHQGCDMQILHFDIKPHNILLDENFIPKISDFGLAKLYPTDNSIVSLTAARGTMGYMAPELFYKNIGGVSYKADVYSFGMLLMEMASKRKNLNALVEHSSQIYFPSWVYDQYNEGNDLEIGDVTEEERKTVKKMVITALWCIQLTPSDRPTMNKVIEMLEGDVESLEMPPKPYFCPQEIPVCDVQDNLNPVCSNVELTCTLSAR